MPKKPRKSTPATLEIAPTKLSEGKLSPASELPTAGVIRRIAALGYDAFLLFGLLVAPLFIATAAMSSRQNLPQDSVTHELPAIAPKPVLLIYMIVVIVSFYVYFWRKSGQTLAMQAWRIRVDSNTGGRPSWKQCFIRTAIGLISLSCAGLGYWWAWIDKEGRSWHDRASNTRVVSLPKKKD